MWFLVQQDIFKEMILPATPPELVKNRVHDFYRLYLCHISFFAVEVGHKFFFYCIFAKYSVFEYSFVR